MKRLKPTLWEDAIDKQSAFQAEQYLCDVINLWRAVCHSFLFRNSAEFVLHQYKQEIMRVHGWDDIEADQLAWFAAQIQLGFPDAQLQTGEFDGLRFLLSRANIFGP